MTGILGAWARPEGSEAGPSERKKIPKVAVYVSGAAFAITTGLTLLILPYARQAARMNRIPTEFRSNSHLITKRPRPETLSPRSISSTASAEGSGSRATMTENEEAYTEHEMQGEPMGGFMAFKAFGIATAIVLGSAGLGAWGVAKFLGVNDMEEFSLKMREKMEIGMPGLTTGMRKYGKEPDELGDFLDEMGREPGELDRPTGMPS